MIVKLLDSSLLYFGNQIGYLDIGNHSIKDVQREINVAIEEWNDNHIGKRDDYSIRDIFDLLPKEYKDIHMIEIKEKIYI